MPRNVLILGSDLAQRHRPWETLGAGDTGLLIVPPHAPCPESPLPVHVAEGYYSTSELEEVAYDAHRRAPFTHVVEFAEYDIERAAVLRELLGIAGTTWAQAATGRHKPLMKRLWDRASIPTARHAVLREAGDLYRFAGWIGYPVVVKPASAAGSVGVSILREEADARAWLAAHWRKNLLDTSVPSWMVEEYVPGSIIQVDGLLTPAGLDYLWPSRVSNLLSWQEQGPATLTITTCAPGDEIVARARELARSAVLALTPRPFTAFIHAEMFELPDGSLRMGEIAWRPGGALTLHMLAAAFEVDPFERLMTALLDPKRLTENAVPDVPVRMAGQVGVGHRPGVVKSIHPIPEQLRHTAGVVHAEITAQPGQAYDRASTSTDLRAKAVVAGATPDVVHASQLLIAHFFEDEGVRYLDSPADALVFAAPCTR